MPRLKLKTLGYTLCGLCKRIQTHREKYKHTKTNKNGHRERQRQTDILGLYRTDIHKDT